MSAPLSPPFAKQQVQSANRLSPLQPAQLKSANCGGSLSISEAATAPPRNCEQQGRADASVNHKKNIYSVPNEQK